MKESAQAALTFARSRAESLGIAADYFEKHDVHIHVPEGAIPKDGPSAGVTMATAMISAFCGRPVLKDVAMTGEITLRGEVLPIGGVKEKVLAARRAGLKTILMPKENERDLTEIPEEMRKGLNFAFAATVDDVLAIALRSTAVRARGKKAAPPRSARRGGRSAR
jgi:ATP-dependent Lon protease